MVTRPLVLKARNRQPNTLDPVVRVESVQLTDGVVEPQLQALINGVGLGDYDDDGLCEHTVNTSRMWLADLSTNLTVEFALPEPVRLSAIELWNFNGKWQTTNGMRRCNITVSADGRTWQTAIQDVALSEAEGTDDYDEPTVVKLGGVLAQKVRLTDIEPIGSSGKVGLSEVVFREQPGDRALPLQPQDGARAVRINSVELKWTTVSNAAMYRVYLGLTPENLNLVCTTNGSRAVVNGLSEGTTYYWRVDTVPVTGRVIRGRLSKFTTGGLIARWQFDKLTGSTAIDTAEQGNTAHVHGNVKLTQGPTGTNNALEFDGTTTYIECPDSALFDFTDAMSIVAWVKADKPDCRGRVLIFKGRDGWDLEVPCADGRVAFYPAGVRPAEKSALPLLSTRAVDDGQWHHVVATYDGQTVALYLDGQLESACGATGALTVTQEPVLIGKSPYKRQPLFCGWLADVRIYNCGLTKEQVQKLFAERND